MTATLLVAVAAGVATVGVLLVMLRLLRDAGDRADERLAEVVSDLNERMESVVAGLSDALEQAQAEGRRHRYLGELAGSLDLDRVVEQVLEAAAALPGVDAALVSLAEAGREPAIATRGLSPQEAERFALAHPLEGRAQAVTIAYEYSDDELTAGEPLIQLGVAVPIAGESEGIGLLAVFSRTRHARVDDEDVRSLEQLARSAGPAIDNARRFREARQLADIDALTGLHNRRYFHETLGREVARAQRYKRRLALVLLDLDDFKQVNDRIGHLAGDAVLAEIGERMLDVVRSSDIACRIGGEEFAIVCPESTLREANQLYGRLLQEVSSRPIAEAGRITLSGGITQLRGSDDATTIFERADEALYRAKAAGKARAFLANGDHEEDEATS